MQGLIPVASVAQMDAARRKQAEATQQSALVQNLSSHVTKRWTMMRDGKRDIEERMLKCLRRRRGEYDPDKLAEIKAHGGSEIFMMITSTKCRAAASWIADALLGSGSDKPWALDATPVPDLPPELVQELEQELMAAVWPMVQATGGVDPAQLRSMALAMKDARLRRVREEADARVDRMERTIEDQLAEGGFVEALAEFIDDLVTFPYAVLKGPVLRRRPTLTWTNGQLTATEEIRPEWARVDPFKFYWAPWVSKISNGPCIELVELTREDLEAMIGVDGYDEDAIRLVLSEFERGGLKDWLWIESAKAEAEGRPTSSVFDKSGDVIEALCLWDSVPGKWLLDKGMTNTEIPDPEKTYPCEIWQVGKTTIRAVLNYDPMARKPYYVTSYEKVPGAVAGNGVADLCMDSQDMCNGAARSLANNMALASGPQCWINVSRMPRGENITQMYPWKVWQGISADFSTSEKPIEFFQPNSNAQELMAVFERFSARADEDTGIPRYMTGDHVPGVGRTSSGLSMLISNAGKSIKKVISSIDLDVLIPAVTRIYHHNLRYNPDPEFVGDLNVIARGASSLIVKEAEAARRNEFLQLVLNSPVAQQIVGMQGAGELLRSAALHLDGNVDRVVPPRQVLAMREKMLQIASQQQAQMENATQERQEDGTPQGGRESNFVSRRPNGK